MSKQVTRDYWCNCYLPILKLLLQGRLRGLIWVKPYHLIGVTHKFNYVHFSSNQKHDKYKPLWYEGRVKTSRPYRIKRYHKEFIFYGHKCYRARQSTWVRHSQFKYDEGTA